MAILRLALITLALFVVLGACCGPSETPGTTPYLHYPTPQDCSVLATQTPVQLCNYHCRKVCKDVLGLSYVPSISWVASATLATCQAASDVPGFSTGTVTTVDVCCADPNPPSCPAGQSIGTTPYLHYPTPQDCSDLATQTPTQLCNYHCRKVCKDVLGLSYVPSISWVASATLATCQAASAVPGFSTGTVTTVDVCCADPNPPSCPAGQSIGTTPNLHYPTPQDCSVLATQTPVQLCNYHCRKVCKEVLGLSYVPSISFVASATLATCQAASAVPGFSTGTVTTVTVCCAIP